jgi:hypothetical protein
MAPVGLYGEDDELEEAEGEEKEKGAEEVTMNENERIKRGKSEKKKGTIRRNSKIRLS